MQQMLPYLKTNKLAYILKIHPNTLKNLVEGNHESRDPDLIRRAYYLMRAEFLGVQTEVKGLVLPVDLFPQVKATG